MTRTGAPATQSSRYCATPSQTIAGTLPRAVGEHELEELAAVALLARLDLADEQDLIDLRTVFEFPHRHARQGRPAVGRTRVLAARTMEQGARTGGGRSARCASRRSCCSSTSPSSTSRCRTSPRDLGSSFTDLQWVVDAYALSLAALLLTAGSLADLFGRRRIFVIGLGAVHARLAAVRPGDDAGLPHLARAPPRASAARRCSRRRWRCSPRPSAGPSAARRSASGARPSAPPSRSARSSAAC